MPLPPAATPYKLFIPGPVAVSEKTLRAMLRQPIGHRSPESAALSASCQPGLDLAALNQTLKSKHRLVADTGYGKLKGWTLRLSNMGDETDATIWAQRARPGAAAGLLAGPPSSARPRCSPSRRSIPGRGATA